MRGGGKGKETGGEGRGGALPVTMAVSPAAERPWVTWSAVEAQEKPEAPFRKKSDGSIVASGSAVVDLRRMNRTHADGEEGGEQEECGGVHHRPRSVRAVYICSVLLVLVESMHAMQMRLFLSYSDSKISNQ
jgi:hypothetical protein